MNNLKTFARLRTVYLEEAVLMAMGDAALNTWEIISKRLGIPAYAKYGNRHYAIVHGILRKLADEERVKRHPNRVVGEHWIRTEDT